MSGFFDAAKSRVKLSGIESCHYMDSSVAESCMPMRLTSRLTLLVLVLKTVDQLGGVEVATQNHDREPLQSLPMLTIDETPASVDEFLSHKEPLIECVRLSIHASLSTLCGPPNVFYFQAN